MRVTKPTFIVAELPPDIAEWVRETRLIFEPAMAITLAGSAGVGPVSVGQSTVSVYEMDQMQPNRLCSTGG
jgi:hypothetical protein